MAIVRWDPFRELSELQDRVKLVFGNFGPATEDDVIRRGAWVPPVDIYGPGADGSDGTDGIVLKAELPGMKRADIELTVENGTLTLRGEKKFDANVNSDHVHRTERAYGTFTRSFTLPSTVDTSHVTAEYKDGVLTVRLPLREDAKPKQIQVKVA